MVTVVLFEYPFPPLVIVILLTVPDIPYGSPEVADCVINEELEFKVTVPSH